MKKKIIKLSILAVTLCAVLFTTFVPALADSASDGSYRPLARYISENGTLVQSGLNGWQQTTSQFKFIGDDIQSADIVEIGFPSTYAPSYNSMPSISGTIAVTNNSPAVSIVLANKEVFYITSNCIYGMNAVGEFEVITQVSQYFTFSVYITMVDDGYGFAYVLSVDDSVYYGIAFAEGLRDITSFGGVFLYPDINHRSNVWIESVVFSEMTVDQSLMAGYGVLFYAMNEQLDFIVGEAYQQGFEEGGALGYEEGYADGLADGSASGGGNTDGSYDEGYAAGKTDGFNEGYTQGKTEGQVIGQDIGYTAGLAAGKELGYADGKADGLAEVEEKEEAAYNNGFTAGKTEGKAEGYTDGKADGLADLEAQKNASYNQGFDAGEDQGYSEGYEDGYDVGRQEGIETGAQTGYDSGYFAGYEKGEEVGYSNGHADGIQYAIDQRKDAWIETGYEMGYEDGEKSGLADLEERCEEAYYNGVADGEVTGWDDGYLAGESVGISKGKVIGHDEGYALGYNKGDIDGFNRGIGQADFLFDAVNGTWHGVIDAYETLADGISLFGTSLRSVVATAGLVLIVSFVVKVVRGS